jgi:hypothetical protein
MFNRRAALALALLLVLPLRPVAAAEDLPSKISDADFWQMIEDFSEPNGYFRFENFLSNESSFQQVIPTLQEKTKPGGVYLGVGPEQNFTYIAALRPKIAFVIDIRRQNMLEHLMYKAIFELSESRTDFVSLLFSRKRAAALNNRSSAEDLFLAYGKAQPEQELFDHNAQAIMDNLIRRHHFALSTEDQNGIKYVYGTFFKAGTAMDYGTGGGGFGAGMPTYSDLMIETDGQGQHQSFLATEENFRILKRLEENNLLVPVVGDFAGPRAIREIGRYLHAHNAPVTAFYLSNVERYLFEDISTWRKFYINVAILPYDSNSQFIRAVLNGAGFLRSSRRFGFGSVSLLCPIADLMKAFSEGRINYYEDVIEMSN